MEKECAPMPFVKHVQELRTVGKLLHICIFKKTYSKKSYKHLGTLLGENGIMDLMKWNKWEESIFKTEKKMPTKVRTMTFFKAQIEKDFRARNILMSWLGQNDNTEMISRFDDEIQFAIEEICEREDLPENIRREEYEKFGLKAGPEEGPNCVFEALLTMEIEEKEPDILRKNIVDFMTKNKPTDEVR